MPSCFWKFMELECIISLVLAVAHKEYVFMHWIEGG